MALCKAAVRSMKMHAMVVARASGSFLSEGYRLVASDGSLDHDGVEDCSNLG